MEHKHPTPARPDIASDPMLTAPVDPLIPSDFADSKPGNTAIALSESPAYDPAEYRWVPVRRRPRHDGWTEEKQRRFIEVLADTGLVGHAAKAVGMSRESARHHAGRALEDIAFERAIEGVEHHVYNEFGEIVCTKRVVSDRLLTFLLSNLMPERYSKEARSNPAPPVETVDATLRAMEPQLPAPPEELLGRETLADELEIANAADGVLPQFLSEQHPPKSDAQLKAGEIAAQNERGKAAAEKLDLGQNVGNDEYRDFCHYLDPTQRQDKGRKRYR